MLFGLFSNARTVLGLDIKHGYIRFVAMRRDDYEDRIASYGEIVPDAPLFRGMTILDENALAVHIKNIMAKTRAKHVVVSLPLGIGAEAFADVFRLAGVRPKQFVSPGSALVRACVPDQSPAPELVVAMEDDGVEFVASGAPRAHTRGAPDAESISANIRHIRIDRHDDHGEVLSRVMLAGSRAHDRSLSSFIARAARIHVVRANPFVNMRRNHGHIPIMTRDDSYKYAVALGLAIS